MRTHRHCLLSGLEAVLLCMTAAPAVAFDDGEFCVAAQQLALAADKDIGLWIDRTTRNAGMSVSCDKKVIAFKRFTYAPFVSMDGAWIDRKTAEWSAAHCNSPIWAEAIRNRWKIALDLTTADGGHLSLVSQCR